MATSSFSVAPINDTDAHFRAWGSALSVALTAVGLTNITSTITSATAINGIGGPTWANITKPGAVDTYPGYEVFRFSDTHQATHPIFIKIEYGTCHAGVNVPGIRLTVGRAINTADGTFTGNISAVMATTTPAVAGSSTAYDCFISGDTDRMNVTMFVNSTSYGFAFFVERTKDDTGATTNESVDIYMQSATQNTANCYHQHLPSSGSAYPSTPGSSPICDMPSDGRGTWGINIGLYPIKPNMGYAGNPTLGGCMYFTGDIPSGGAMVVMTLYGVSHTFVTLGISNVGAVNGNSTAHSIAVRYE